MVAKLARQRTRAMSLAFLMVMMVQTGYLGTTDPWWSIEQDEVVAVSTSSAAGRFAHAECRGGRPPRRPSHDEHHLPVQRQCGEWLRHRGWHHDLRQRFHMAGH